MKKLWKSLCLAICLALCMIPLASAGALADEKNAAELTKEWFGSESVTIKTNITIDASALNQIKENLSAYGAIRANDFLNNQNQSNLYSTETRKKLILEYEKTKGIDFQQAIVTWVIKGITVSGNIITLDAEEWTLLDYDCNNDNILTYDTFGYSNSHKLSIEKVNSNWSIRKDTYNEAIAEGIYDSNISSKSRNSASYNLSLTNTGISANKVSLSASYNAPAAVAYADKYWSSYNPNFPVYAGVDCANFVSQCLNAGGLTTDGTWYSGSYAWVNVGGMYNYLTGKGYRSLLSPDYSQYAAGDVIMFGNLAHTMLCVGRNSAGTPIYNAHTNDRYHEPLSFYWDSAGNRRSDFYVIKMGGNTSSQATINIHANGGIEKTKSITVTYGNKCNLSQNFVMRNGYKLKGWNLYRPADNKWFATGKGWFTASEIASKGYQKHLYIPNLSMELENSWYGNNSSNAAITNFTFYAIWEVEDIDTNTCSPIASTKYNGKIYELYDNAASWNTANTAATKLGGYLACITSSSENTAIHNLIKNSGSKNCYWIGGSNLNDSQNKFHWVSGESFTYTNWAEKEPSLGTEHFVMMYKSNGLWNVLPVEGANYDSGNMGFIVEKNAPINIDVTGVTLDKSAITLDKGSSTTLTATVAPANATNKTVTWKSSDASVATVDSGKVTAVNAGTATITVTTADGNKTATCKVTVTEKTPGIVNVTSVALDSFSVALEEGGSTTLTATVAPANATNKAVTWKSSNTSVATVNNGTVFAVNAGTAVITVTTADGNKSADCVVIVIKKDPAAINVTGVTLDQTTVSLEEGSNTTLTATVAPANATNKAVTWKTTDASVATVDNGKVTAVKAGAATITVTTADGGKTAACEIKVTAKAPEVNFSDVAADAWYVSYVYDLAGKGIINGITPTTFDPEGKITRGQFVKILAYASGDDLSAYSGDSVFADANAHWSKANINWAYTNKIVYGKSDTQFAPDANITRQEMAVMIKRYADYKNITLPKTNAPITFTDEAEIAAWAKEAVSAMQQANIISGFPDGTFAPQGNATRAQAAKMISVFLSL